MSDAHFPWKDITETGLGVLRIPPSEFWGMTPREFLAAVKGFARRHGTPYRDAALQRTELEGLSRQFPDG